MDWKRIDSHLGLHFSGAQAVSYKHFVEVTIPNILPSLSDEQTNNLENEIVDVTEKHRYELMMYQVHTDDFLKVRQNIISEVLQDL